MNYDLSEMVRMSPLIAIVVPAQPPMYEKHISLKKEWEQLSDDLKNLPLSNEGVLPEKSQDNRAGTIRCYPASIIENNQSFEKNLCRHGSCFVNCSTL